MGIDKSNPFERSGDDVELYREYGSGGRDVPIRPAEKGVDDGTSNAQHGVGEATQGGPSNP